MASKALYDLTLKISANTAELKRGLEESNRRIKSFHDDVADKIGKVKNIFLGAAAAIGGIETVLNVVKTGFNATGKGADFLEQKTAVLKATFVEFSKSITDLKFTGLIVDLTNSARAAEDFVKQMDNINTALSDLSIRQSSLQARLSELRYKQVEGTLTTEEQKELINAQENLFNEQKAVYDRALQEQIEYIAKKNYIDKETFSVETLEKGAAERSDFFKQLSKEDYKKWQDTTVNQFKQFQDDLGKKYYHWKWVKPAGFIFPIPVKVPDEDKIKKELDRFIKNLTPAQQLEIFENVLASPEEYNAYINYLKKINDLEREYYETLKKEKNLKSTPPTPPTPTTPPKEEPEFTKIAPPPVIKDTKTLSLARPINEMINTLQLVPMKMGEIHNYWAEILTEMSSLTLDFTDVIGGLGDAITNAAEDGKVSFGEMMDIITQTALRTIPVLGALAAANIISEESRKGLVGIFTGVAALTALMGLWTKFVKDKNKYFTGTSYASGGWSLVGEAGPELVNIPRGSRVLSALETQNALIGGKATFVLRNDVLVAAIERHNKFKRSYA